jgi:hypothetical protein
LKKANRPLSSIEPFALEFAPRPDEQELARATGDLPIDATASLEPSDPTASEVPTISVHALDVLAEVYAQKNPRLARFYLKELAEKYDTLRKGYWGFRLERLGKGSGQ